MKVMRNPELYNTFLSLVRLGIGLQVDSIKEDIDWKAVQVLAMQHGVSAVILDGIEQLPENQRPSKAILLPWIGSTLNQYEQRYIAYQKSIASLAAFYNAHGFKMMVLKGLACSLDWPRPEHRPCGDIDIWLFGQQKEADEMLQKLSRIGELENKIKVDRSHHHHTVFAWEGFVVENHYDFINTHHHQSHAEMERIFKELGQDDSHSIDVLGEKVYLPSPNLHALFLLKHTMLHFASESVSLRQLLDWGFFVKANSAEIDWDWLEDKLIHFGMKEMYDILNAICVGELGFDVKYFHDVQFNSDMKERVLNEILSPEYPIEAPRCLFPRMLFKYRRWKGNEWKHKLCYKESMWSAFWSGVWNHLLKPSSI